MVIEDLAMVYVTQCSAYVSFLEFYSFWFYIQVFSPFWVYSGEKRVFSKVALGELENYVQKNEIRTLSNTMHENKLKMG